MSDDDAIDLPDSLLTEPAVESNREPDAVERFLATFPATGPFAADGISLS